jgi:hypothetical protein
MGTLIWQRPRNKWNRELVFSEIKHDAELSLRLKLKFVISAAEL